ncbi:hypothetical protein [Halocatena pleomorpha]|uniref:DUF8142 domain-containing protein n=1 Tax=Halocatena pleomorpha TaxID=1785090 RepID=A0A3P3RHS8_9EURY|nr:hypothetical protein [Halocatena pleomorpha]RRJ33127.1 hypothetical protein EIK79_03630 [Halocatena pleomorpha]
MDGNDRGISGKRALLAIVPFLALGLMCVVFLLQWGLSPLWAIMILPPILFMSVLGWLAFRGGFMEDRTGPQSVQTGDKPDGE